MTVRRLLTEMDSRELSEWMAYDRVEPFGRDCDDASRAIATAVLANVNRDPDKQRKPWTPHDFMPFPDGRPKPKPKIGKQSRQTVEHQKRIALMIAQLEGRLKTPRPE